MKTVTVSASDGNVNFTSETVTWEVNRAGLLLIYDNDKIIGVFNHWNYAFVNTENEVANAD